MTAAAAARPILVLHAPADEAFVRGFLLPALGPSARGAAVVDARDLAAAEVAALDLGAGDVAALDHALLGSGVAIPVLTPAFLTNPWSRQSEALAASAAVGGELEVVPLVLEDCALPPHIRYRVLLDFRRRERWDGEAERLRDHLVRPRPVAAELPCPYPGMRPFRAEDARYFHGRDAEIDAVLALIAAGEREITLVGPSGSGKSSLLAAGVLPRLAAQPGGELVVRTMRPGDAPVGRLAECLELAAEPGAAAPPAVDAVAVAGWAMRHAGARLVVVIDQLEEMFAQAADAERERFAAALAALRGEPRCVVVLALRADFYAELLLSPLWLDGRRRSVDLPPLRGAGLRAAIERPARALEVYFEPGLIDRLLGDAAGEPGALPLLQETLVQLWGVRRHRLFTSAAYDALGEGGRSGLAVAISSRADRCLAGLTPAQVAIARRVLLRLVSFGEGRPDTRRRQTRAQLAAGEPAELAAVLEPLIAARLIIPSGDGAIDLCHEVLITAWPALAGWSRSRRGDELRRRQLQASADDWVARGRGASGLLDDGELASAAAWRASDAAVELGESPEVRALIDASGRALSHARARRRWLLAGVVGGLAVFGAVTATLAVTSSRHAAVAEARRIEAEHQSAEAERQRIAAERAQVAAMRALGEQFRETGRQAVVAGQLQRAIPYLVAARDQGLDDPPLRGLFHLATAASVVVALRHAGPVAAVGLGGDAARVVTASGDEARVWDAATGAPLSPPLVHPRPVVDAVLRGDGARAVTIAGNTAWIWEVSEHPPPPIALHHAARITTAVFSADGEQVMTASHDRTVRRWSARTGEPLGPPLVHQAQVWVAAISRDGARIATAVNEGRSAGLWNPATGARIAGFEDDPMTADLRHITAHVSLVQRVAFSADGRRVVTAGTDHRAMIWDAATGKLAGPVLEPGEEVRDAALGPDGARVATVGLSGEVRMWNAQTGAQLRRWPDAHAVRVEFTGDGARLIAQGGDKTVRMWDAATGAPLLALELESDYDLAVSRDAARLVTATFDGVARIWRAPAAPSRVIDPATRVFDAAFSPDGARIATSDGNGAVRLWRADGSLVGEAYPGVGAATVVFDPTGRRLAAISLDGTVEFADAATGAWQRMRRVQGRNPTGSPDSPRKVYGHQPARGAFSPDGRWFATLSGKATARIWNTETGAAAGAPLVHGAAVRMARWSPDGRRVVTASDDGTARVWDAATGAAIGAPLRHPAETSVTMALFAPDGRRIVTLCSDDKVRVWDGADQPPKELVGHTGVVISAEFSPDGARLLTNSDDNSARLWDLATGALAIPPLEHGDQVGSAALSPDGTRLVTTSARAAQIWDARTGRPLGPPLSNPSGTRAARWNLDGSSVLVVGIDAVELWDAGLDSGSIDDWHRVARDSSLSQLGATLGATFGAGASLPTVR